MGVWFSVSFPIGIGCLQSLGLGTLGVYEFDNIIRAGELATVR